jgi:cytochrome P450
MHVRRLMDKPGDDVMSDVIRAHREDPELFDEEYLYRTMLNLLFAGHETTTNATSNMFQTLLADRALWRTVCEDPSVASNAVEESLRYCSSVIAWRRHSIDDFTIGDVTIPAGSKRPPADELG